MQAPQKIEKNRELKFVASEYEQISGNNMLTINNLNVFREEKMLIQGINLKVSAGDKVAVIGPNKSGKTTFFETILSKPKQVKWNKFAKVGYFAQDLNNLDFDKSLWKNIKKGSNQSQQFIYDLLGGIGFSAPQFNQLTASLSGGEIVKANLARILVGDYNFLMLDEPTNYLDLQAIHALTDFLINYPNTVLLISHDQVFTNKVSKRIYVVKNKRLINHKALNIGKTEKAQKILLEYELDNLINDPSSNIDQIKKIRSQIDHS
ncbi:ATP-binding cassette domain-containing protein [Oenococcus oeni]|uniref:ATP-binding cassette domain-containing protein n=2 Tax=Oenococcus oeni TaxID=1247 RepID=UPI0009AEB1A9|nr:ATP-binding cassette domain-containing protein [Oenococcus oeni]